MTTGGQRLGIDFGTSTTVATLAGGDGRVRPLLFDGSELLPSAVCRTDDGALLVGRDALHAARSFPAAFEPNPKRRIDEGTVLLGAAEVPVTDLIAAVLRRVVAEARRTAGEPIAETVLTHPAGWAATRRQVLVDAAGAAGITAPLLVVEPVAAAAYLTAVAGVTVPVGATLVVYDFGAGTFDAALLRRTAGGFEVLADGGLPDTGGLDVDAAVLASVVATFARRDAQLARRLTAPATGPERRAARQLQEDVRTAKELLSRGPSVMIHVPYFDVDSPLGREQFERLARNVLDRTVMATQAVVTQAGSAAADVQAVLLVGGSSRIPLVATLLHRALGVAPTVLDRPELIVAEGALHVEAAVPHAATTIHPAPPDLQPARPPVPPAVAPAPPADLLVPGGPRPSGRRIRSRTIVAAAVVALLAVVGGTMLYRRMTTPDAVGQSAGRPPVPPGSGGARPSAGETASFRWRLSGHTDSVTVVEYAPGGDWLASAGGDGTVRLWNPETGEAGQMQRGYPEDLAFDRTGARIIIGSFDGVKIWTPATGTLLEFPNGEVSTVGTRVRFVRDGTVFASTAYGNVVRLRQATDGHELCKLAGHTAEIQRIAATADGSTLATTSLDGTAGLWNLTTCRATTVLKPPVARPLGVAFDPAGAMVAVGSDKEPYVVRLWKVDGTHVRDFTGHSAQVQDVAFSPDGKLLGTASSDGTVRVWTVATGQELARFKVLKSFASTVAFDPKRPFVAGGGADQYVWVWPLPRTQ